MHGRWVHAHEQDTDEEMIFVSPARPLPPSRGRTSFELRSDGTYVESSPGPVDAPIESTGSWWLDGERLVWAAEGDRQTRWEIMAADGERLVLKRSQHKG